MERVGDIKMVEEDATTSCRDSYLNGNSPITAIQEYLTTPKWQDALLALKQVGNGSSAWAQLYTLKSC